MKKAKQLLAALMVSVMMAGSLYTPVLAVQAGQVGVEESDTEINELQSEETKESVSEPSLGALEDLQADENAANSEEAIETEKTDKEEDGSTATEVTADAEDIEKADETEEGNDAAEEQVQSESLQEQAEASREQTGAAREAGKSDAVIEQTGAAREAGKSDAVIEQTGAAQEAGKSDAIIEQTGAAQEAGKSDANIEQTGAAQETRETGEGDVIIEQNGVVIFKSTPAVESAESFDEEAPRFSELSDALQYVREGMIERNETVALNMPKEVFDQLDLVHYSDIMDHTGDPDGGDYLRSAVEYFGASYSTMGDGEYWIEYFFTYKTSVAQEAEVDAEVNRLVSSLGLKDGAKSDYDKIKAIHDYIVENVEYDYDTLYGVTTDYWETYAGYGAIVNHLAVCQGFASMFYRLCLEAGIDARIISSGELGHAWNIVQLDGLYYLMDCTWDENTGTDNYFLRGKYDFEGHANSDDEFSDASFAARYPLSDYRYGYESGSLGKAPDYTLITQDRRTVSTAAQNGRAKVLIFFLDSCWNFLYTVGTLEGKEYDGVDFVYANMLDYNTEQLQDILSQIGDEMPADVPGTYAICANGGDARAEFERITGLDDGSGWIYSASVFLISPDNEILFAENGYAGEIGTMVEAMLEDSDLPDAPDPGEDPYAGFTEIGLCGKNAVWRFYGGDGGAYSKGTLLINGSGALWNYNYFTKEQFGWLTDDMKEEDSCSGENIQASAVKRVIFEDGITNIGDGNLAEFTSLESITFKGTASSINSGHGLNRDICIYYPEDEDSWESVDRSSFTEGCKWISQDEDGVHHHKWGDPTVTKEATCTEEGSAETACTECGEKTTEAIPATGHNWAEEYTTDKAPTRTEEGVESIHCLVCDAIREGSERAIPMREQEPQELTLSSEAADVVMGQTVVITVEGAQGALTCEAEDPSMATATVSGSTITVNGQNTGSVKLIIRAAETDGYEAAEAEFELNVVPGKTTRGDMFNLANNVKVTWKEVPGAVYYKVYRTGVSDPSESLDEPVIVTTALVGWDKSPGLTNGNAYRYRIVASTTGRGDPSGDSPLSYSKLMYRLKTVVIRSAKNTAPGKVTVKYDRTTSGDSYVLQYCERQDMVGAKTKVVLGASNTSYVIGGLKKGRTYYISIRVRKKVSGIDYYTTFGVAKKVTITK